MPGPIPAHEPPAQILLVDDEPANLLAREALLGDLGHRQARTRAAATARYRSGE